MVKDISSFIESQFPAVYRNEGKTFVAFVKAYYEWLDQQSNIDLLDSFDIDRTIEGFTNYFKKTYLSSFPFVKASSVDFLIKHIYDYYRSKGTEESVRLLIMMMFGEEATIYNPSDHILKPSASRWREPRYLEVDSRETNYEFVGKQVYGIRSNAKAIVESVVTKAIKGKYVDIIYVSSLKGSFLTGEKITYDGNIQNAPNVIGSLTNINVSNGGKDFKVGDVLNVGSEFGLGGQVRVKSVINSTGRVDFELVDGGSGYTTTPTTDIYISDGVIFLDNGNENFIDLETVKQQIERLSLLSAGTISDDLVIGADIRGVDENGTEVATGYLSDVSGPTSEPTISVAVTSGTFVNQRQLAFAPAFAGAVIDFDVTTSHSLYFRIGDANLGPSGHLNLVSMIAAGTHHITATVPTYSTSSFLGFVSEATGATVSVTNWTITNAKTVPLNNPDARPQGITVNSVTPTTLNYTSVSGGRRVYAIPLPVAMDTKLGDLIETPSRQTLTLSNTTGMAVGNRLEQVASVSFTPTSGRIVMTGSWANNEDFKQENGSGVLLVTGRVVQRSGTNNMVDKLLFFNGATTVSTSFPITNLTGTKTGTVTSYFPGNNSSTTISRVYGTVESISGSNVVVYPAFGDFVTDYAVTTYDNTNTVTGTSAVTTTSVTTQPSRGSISSLSGVSMNVRVILGAMPSAGGTVWNLRTRAQANVVTNTNIGATDIRIGGVATANAVIDVIEDISRTAIVVGQNTSSIGVWGNTAPFITAQDMINPSTITSVSQITVPSNNHIVVTVGASHPFAVNDWVKGNINIQVGNEIKNIDGVYRVTAIGATTATLNIPNPDFEIFGQTFTIFPSTISKTTLIAIRTDRQSMISPPKDANGNIVEVVSNGITSSKGFGADFKIGTIENEEVVFLETDFLKDRNVANVFYRDIYLDGKGSSIGFVGSIRRVSNGSAYSNGALVTFSGGGMNGGEPTRQASAYITTNGSGEISLVTVTDHGEGYWEDPKLILPATSGTTANLVANMDYGYGFPKLPNGDETNLLIDLLDRQPMTIGTISSLNSINPGQGYDADPFVKVYNRYVAGFQRKNFLLNFTDKIGSFMSGEMVYQNIGGVVFPKGIVIEDYGNTALIKRTFFATSFDNNAPLIGATTGSTGVVASYEELDDSPVMGDNADITARVISANGIINEVEVIDSGWGYIDGERGTLSSSDSVYVVEGNIINQTQGKGVGYWDTEVSHLNSQSKIQDSDYYQEFSYEVVSPVSFERYRNILQDIMHVAGTKMFGRFEQNINDGSIVETASQLEITNPQAPISSLYGTNDGNIVIHYLPEYSAEYGSGYLERLVNIGGYGSTHDATATDLQIRIEGGRVKTNMNVLQMLQSLDLVGHRVFFVAQRAANWRDYLLAYGSSNNYAMVRRLNNTDMLSVTQLATGHGWAPTRSGTEYPRANATAIYEFGAKSGSLEIVTAWNGGHDASTGNVVPASSFTIESWFGGPEASGSKNWDGYLDEIIILKEGTADTTAQVEQIREYLLNKYGITPA